MFGRSCWRTGNRVNKGAGTATLRGGGEGRRGGKRGAWAEGGEGRGGGGPRRGERRAAAEHRPPALSVSVGRDGGDGGEIRTEGRRLQPRRSHGFNPSMWGGGGSRTEGLPLCPPRGKGSSAWRKFVVPGVGSNQAWGSPAFRCLTIRKGRREHETPHRFRWTILRLRRGGTSHVSLECHCFGETATKKHLGFEINFLQREFQPQDTRDKK